MEQYTSTDNDNTMEKPLAFNLYIHCHDFIMAPQKSQHILGRNYLHICIMLTISKQVNRPIRDTKIDDVTEGVWKQINTHAFNTYQDDVRDSFRTVAGTRDIQRSIMRGSDGDVLHRKANGESRFVGQIGKLKDLPKGQPGVRLT